mgnify:CR=1 FL=1
MKVKSVCFFANSWEAEGFLCSGGEEWGWICFVLDWVIKENYFCLFVFGGICETGEEMFTKSCDLFFC